MSNSWVYLVAIGVLILVLLTGIHFYESITGGNQSVNYQIDNVEPNFGDDVLKHLEEGQDSDQS